LFVCLKAFFLGDQVVLIWACVDQPGVLAFGYDEMQSSKHANCLVNEAQVWAL
jgi:hypothetical protein